MRYRPCLRWNQGEYQAILRLKESIKSEIVPLIEVPKIGWDFEEKEEKATIDDHLEPLPGRVIGKWGTGQCMLDCRYVLGYEMKSGIHPILHLHHELRSLGCHVVPVMGPEADAETKKAISEVLQSGDEGLTIRIPLETAATDVDSVLPRLADELGIARDQTDVIVDLGVPNFQPLDGFFQLIMGTIRALPVIDEWRSMTILGSSMIATMAEVKKGVSILTRHEWVLFKKLNKALKEKGIRQFSYGDYGTRHPQILNIDMRVVKPAASIRYSAGDEWYISKGTNVRDNKYGQYREMCKALVQSSFYDGPNFSSGDEFIYNCASGEGSTGNLSSWVEVGTSHHISRVVLDLASLSET